MKKFKVMTTGFLCLFGLAHHSWGMSVSDADQGLASEEAWPEALRPAQPLISHAQRISETSPFMRRVGFHKTEVIDDVQIIRMDGEIDWGDRTQLRNLLEQPGTKILLIDSRGGYYDEMIRLRDMLQEREWDVYVYVSEYDYCSSACIGVFGAVPKEKRYAHPDAMFGFHSASGGSASKATAGYKNILSTFLNNSWLQANDDLFKTRAITRFLASKMAKNDSGLIDPDHLAEHLADVIRDIKRANK